MDIRPDNIPQSDLVQYFEHIRMLRKNKARWMGITGSTVGLVLMFTILPTFGTMIFYVGLLSMFVAIIL